jgi:chromosome segregation ATPase
VISEKSQKSVKFNLSDSSTGLEELLQQKEEEILSLKMRLSEVESLQHPLDLKDNYEKALLDLEELKDEKEQLKQAMNEAINECAKSLGKQQSLEKENQKLQKQVENLANSKLSMQNTLAEQINSLRSQVQRMKEERNELSIRQST